MNQADLLARQSGFRHWLDRLGRPELSPERSSHGRLGYRQTLTLADRPFPLQVIGLDTAWLCGNDADAGKLWLTDGQILKLTTDHQAQLLPGLRLVLMHHPLTDLVDGAPCRRLLAERVDLVLRGHLHELETSLWQDPQRDLREAAAGCLYKHNRYPNSCQVLDIHTDAVGRPWLYDVWFPSWSARGHWFNDDSLYQGSRLSRISLILNWEEIRFFCSGKLFYDPVTANPGLTFWAKSPILYEEGTEVFTMPNFAAALGASKAASTLLVLYIPSKDRDDKSIDQGDWVGEALRVLGTLFGGATAFPQGKGVWRDDAQASQLLFDEPVVIQCYTSEQALEQQAPVLRDFLHRMGREALQGAVGLVIDRDYLEIGFPLGQEPARSSRIRKKQR